MPVANSVASCTHLDRQITNRTAGVSLSYDSGTDTNTYTLPYSINTNNTTDGYLTIAITGSYRWLEDPNQVANANIVVSRPQANQIAVVGNQRTLATTPVLIGVLYLSSYELSTIYQRNQKAGVEQRGRLRIGYVNISYLPMTDLTVTVTPQGRDPYTYTFYDPTAQQDNPEIQPFRFPVQCRNEDSTIVFSTFTPGSFRLAMLDWEGQLTVRSRPV